MATDVDLYISLPYMPKFHEFMRFSPTAKGSSLCTLLFSLTLTFARTSIFGGMNSPKAPCFGLLPSPLGWITLSASPLGLVSLHWTEHPPTLNDSPKSIIIEKACAALEQYFAGEFSAWKHLAQQVPLDEQGTPFQKSVWTALRTISCGQTQSYGEVAKKLGNNGSRAVGGACGANPLPIFTPCHRVLAQHGLGGFSAGLEVKRWLLHHEQPVENHFFAMI